MESGRVAKWFGRYNIRCPEWTAPSWDSPPILASVDALRVYAENYALSSIDWYNHKKSWKANGSRFLRFLTLFATALGGLIPIVASLGIGAPTDKDLLRVLQINQYGYFCFGLAALFLALDRYFGNSTGWMRYITTAMALETALMQFRLDWAKLTIRLTEQDPARESLEPLLQRIEEFILTTRALVEKETQTWVTEFQTNLSQLEKESRAALEAAKAQTESAQKEERARKESVRPGAVELTVENVLETDAGYDVLVNGKLTKEGVATKTCGILNLAPGLHEIEVAGLLSGHLSHASKVVTVPVGSAIAVTMTLGRTRAAGSSL